MGSRTGGAKGLTRRLPRTRAASATNISLATITIEHSDTHHRRATRSPGRSCRRIHCSSGRVEQSWSARAQRVISLKSNCNPISVISSDLLVAVVLHRRVHVHRGEWRRRDESDGRVRCIVVKAHSSTAGCAGRFYGGRARRCTAWTPCGPISFL